jgi:hypothetical protein
MAKRGRFYDLEPTPQNFRTIWDLLHTLHDGHTTNLDTIARQQALIDSLTTQLATTGQNAQQALILAGKAASQTSTGVAPAPGGGGGSGGGSGSSHPNYASLVAQAKADLITAGVSLVGPCGGFEIVKRAVQYIAASDPAVGLLDKPTGNNCGGYSVDIICFNDGVIYDVLFDSGGANTPQWNFAGVVPTSRYRPPI